MGIKPETLQCSLCGTKLCLVAQVSACQFSKILLVELYVSHVRKMSLVVLGHRLIKLQACNSLTKHCKLLVCFTYLSVMVQNASILILVLLPHPI